jgi:hypothetical protein
MRNQKMSEPPPNYLEDAIPDQLPTTSKLKYNDVSKNVRFSFILDSFSDRNLVDMVNICVSICGASDKLDFVFTMNQKEISIQKRNSRGILCGYNTDLFQSLMYAILMNVYCNFLEYHTEHVQAYIISKCGTKREISEFLLKQKENIFLMYIHNYY